MNALDLLREDHAYVDQLFTRIEENPPSRHPPILKRIKNELEAHAHIEEKIFYPLLKRKGDKELVKIVTEGLEEHRQMKKFLGEASRTTSKEKREAKLMVLIEDTRHHVQEEENEMFPMVRAQFDVEELEAVGERMEIEKKNFQKKRGITPRRQMQVKGPVGKLMDKAKDLVGAVAGIDNGSSTANGGGKSSGSGSRGGAKPKPSGSKASGKGGSRSAGK